MLIVSDTAYGWNWTVHVGLRAYLIILNVTKCCTVAVGGFRAALSQLERKKETSRVAVKI